MMLVILFSDVYIIRLMRILGIDPGIGRTGWGIIEKEKNGITVVDFGCIETSSEMAMHRRLQLLYDNIGILFSDFKPDSLAVEDLFFNTNAKTAFVVGQARGVILLAASCNGITPFVYTPLQVKIAVTGYGRAQKNQVGMMIKSILRLTAVPKPDDVADALAIAVTHASSMKMNML
jgi:crossover junction endodeoxyribonuclease RuvC